jgi:hypothetical protein
MIGDLMKIPEYDKKPLKKIFTYNHGDTEASMKQKNYILTLCEQRNLPKPDLDGLRMDDASVMIDNFLNVD